MSSLNLDPKNTGKQYWKSLDELGEAPEFKTFLEREFPEGAAEMGSGVSRRKFLQVMGAGMALAGVSGCKIVRRPEQNILPYNKMPESLIPGIPQFYATAMSIGGEAVGLLVESHEGRPTKVEGNPKHPSSQGATGKYHQASVLGLYDQDRSRTPVKGGQSADWNEFWSDAGKLFETYKQNGGQGLRFLSGYIGSPSLADVKAHVLKTYPKAQWTTYESVTRDAQAQGIAAVTGAGLDPHYKFEAAKRVLSIDADFTEAESDHLKYGKAFVSTRNPDLGTEKMSRLYIVESMYTPTGGTADHRLRVKPGQIVNVLILVAKELQAQGLNLGDWNAEISALSADAASAGVSAAYIRELAKDILEHKGASVVVVGKYQPALAHAIGHALNASLGNIGATVEYKPSALKALNGESAGSFESISELANAMGAGQVETLVILDANPAFATPADLDFAGKMAKVKHVINLGPEANETSALSEWHLPLSHFMEEWGDGLAYDGTASIAQPLIQPLYSTQGAAELLAGLSGFEHRKSHDIVKEYWRKQSNGMDFEHKWRESLHDGVIAKTAYASVNPGTAKDGISKLAAAHAAKAPKAGGLEIIFRAHPNLYDGRFANNAWLQELPDPITKLTWDNAAFISPKLADKIGVSAHLFNKDKTGTSMGEYRHRPMVRLTVGGKSVEAVAWIVPGLSEDTVLLHFGYGRRSTGKVGTGTGFDAFAIMNSASPFLAGDVKIEATGGLYEVACTQDHWSLEGRPIVREAGLEGYEENKAEAFSEEKWNEHPIDPVDGKEKSLWTEAPFDKGGARGDYDFSKGMQWGMVIDLNSCTGCNTCLLACTAENNIPVVGKEQVLRGREMHWIRLDRYFSGNIDNPELVFQVMTCQQCENAPCEEVCPVAATVHSHEGLNDMTYNRCIGTRYCSNNCPYKVRRFNFFNYTNQWKNSTLSMQKNPDVTVRFRGVMEKCTYCVQRINRARIQYKNKGQEVIPEGAVTPACAQACPTDAIVFGNINDASSRVAKLKSHPRNYGVLRDLNTKPRTSYLGRVRNPNKAIEKIQA
ncbi:MAG: quinol:cytochrome c oxidoreductase iron-sulfur protein precursor [Fibrobacteres bacterium]|nr:quinol:cytochrome c oxidoreductase iron-sulfur protein precursor [Fibrobacterota bacterium]